MSNEADKILTAFLAKLQKNVLIRKALALLLVLALLGIAGYFIYEIIPRQYNQTITGGEILSNRHYLARKLQEQAAKQGVNLTIKPTAGSQDALQLLNEGKLDFAFIQGGLDLHFANVVHVATIEPELLHFLVRPEIKDISGLNGKRINLGSRLGGTRIVSKQILTFSGLNEGINYVETNISTEELLSMQPQRMPDAIVITSFAPSDIADYLVKERGYTLLELPFPASMALRLGWVADSKILAYMYNVQPAVPAKDIKTVGVNLHLVANKNVEPRAIYAVLESLYSPDLAVKLKIKMDESNMLIPSGYALSDGSGLYLNRNNPFFSNATLDKIKAIFGLLLSVGSTILVIIKWFKGEPLAPEKTEVDDDIFLAYMERVLAVEAEYNALDQAHKTFSQHVAQLQIQLSEIKAEATARLANASFNNSQLPQNLLLIIADTRARLTETGI